MSENIENIFMELERIMDSSQNEIVEGLRRGWKRLNENRPDFLPKEEKGNFENFIKIYINKQFESILKNAEEFSGNTNDSLGRRLALHFMSYYTKQATDAAYHVFGRSFFDINLPQSYEIAKGVFCRNLIKRTVYNIMPEEYSSYFDSMMSKEPSLSKN